MEENTQLPKEVVEEIKQKAEDFANSHINGRTQPDVWEIVFRAKEAGATAYATKLHQLQQVTTESDKQRKEANDQLREAKKLLDEVFRKHEAGLLPDRFIYEKIKSFLYGE